MKYFTTIFLIILTTSAFGQPSPEPISFPYKDTLKFYTANEIDTSTTLEWLFISPFNGAIVDSLDNPKTYFIKSEDGIFIAKKIKELFYVFEVMENSAFVGYDPHVEFSQINFSGVGSDLLIKWSCNGHASSYEGGFEKGTGGIQIWNFKKAIRYFDIKNEYSLGISYNEIITESGDTLHQGGETTDVCQEYKVTIKPQELTIQYFDCSTGKKAEQKEEEEIYTYVFTPHGLIRKKQTAPNSKQK